MIRFEEFKKKWSFLQEKEIFLACSGGVDSMVLLHLMQGVSNKITLLHVNYNLRGEESIGDENFIWQYALMANLPFESKSVDPVALKQGNLQENARKIRYTWFEEKLIPENAVLLLAHHQDDQIETFYLNLARKSGMLGLACMLETDGKYIRPLLSYSKAEIYAYAREYKIGWREDSSNQGNVYARNRLRNEFIPFLEKQLPGLRHSILYLIRVFQENYRETKKSVEKTVSDVKKKAFLDLKVWQNLTDEQRISVLKSFNYTQKQLLEVQKLTRAQKGKSVSSSDYIITRESEGFTFKKRFEKSLESELIIEEAASLPCSFSKDEIYLDVAKISGTLSLRPWKKGDRMFPTGMKGSKLISDIITDAKVLHSERAEVRVVADDQNIHWCVGLKIGRLALADDRSEKILKIRVKD